MSYTEEQSIELYKKAITDAFPQLVIKHIEVDSSGWDNIAVIVNHEILFRFPRRPEVAKTLEIESRLLPELRQIVSLPIPNLEFIAPGFVGYRLIPGEPLTRELFQQLCSTERARVAQQLADFLKEIHSFPIERAIELGVSHTPDQQLWTNCYAEIRRHVFPLLAAHERQWTQQLFETFLDDERNFRFAPVLLHGDFSPDHVLFDRRAKRITGVIDFGDARIGDPAYDFQWCEDYGEALWHELLTRYRLEIDESFFRRLEFYKRRQPLGEILYGVVCDAPEHITTGLQALRQEIKTGS